MMYCTILFRCITMRDFKAPYYDDGVDFSGPKNPSGGFSKAFRDVAFRVWLTGEPPLSMNSR